MPRTDTHWRVERRIGGAWIFWAEYLYQGQAERVRRRERREQGGTWRIRQNGGR